MDNVTSLTQQEMETVNGGSAFWNDFWDGVLKDLQDMANGFHDGIQ